MILGEASKQGSFWSLILPPLEFLTWLPPKWTVSESVRQINPSLLKLFLIMLFITATESKRGPLSL